VVEAFSFLVAAADKGGTDPLVVGVVTAIIGGGAIGAVATLMRAPKQGKLDLMNAAKILYEEQESQYNQVKAELEQVKKDIEECQIDRARLTRELEAERAEIKFLRERITYIEDNMRRRQRQAFEEGVMPRAADEKPDEKP
jgi:predicted RNase H-like nuclease (RuvC/YqgF family)